MEENFQEFYDKLIEILKETIPKSKSKIFRRKKCVSWWNNECELAVKDRENKRKTFKKIRHCIKRNNGTTQELMLNVLFNQQKQTVGKNFALK